MRVRLLWRGEWLGGGGAGVGGALEVNLKKRYELQGAVEQALV